MGAQQKDIWKDISAVTTGTFVTLLLTPLIAVLLFPVAYSFMHMHEQENLSMVSSQNDLAIEITFFAMVAIPVMIGGIVSALLSTKRPLVLAILLSAILLMVIYFSYIYEIFQTFYGANVKLGIVVFISALLGCLIGKKIARKRRVALDQPSV